MVRSDCGKGLAGCTGVSRQSPSNQSLELTKLSSQREEELQEATRRRESMSQQLSQIATKFDLTEKSLKQKKEEARSEFVPVLFRRRLASF